MWLDRRADSYIHDATLSIEPRLARAGNRVRRHGRKTFGENFEPFVEFLVRDRQRSEEADDVAEGTGGNQDDAARCRQLDDFVGLMLRWLACLPGGHEFDADHSAPSPDIPNQGTRLLPLQS